MSNFPSVLTTFTDPTPTNRLNSPSHSSIESAQNSGISQLEAVIGVSGDSSVVGTYEYWVKSPASNGGGHVQTANKGGTGQTAYTKGDILVAKSSSVLSKLAIGSYGQVLQVDSTTDTGLKWSSNTLETSSFLSTGTWNKPSILGTTGQVFVQLWGGGGSGGRNAGGGGGGGGGGAYVEGWIPASNLGLSELVSIGDGGAARTTDGVGNVGGNTVFGSLSSILVAYGGGGGGGINGGGGGGGGAYSVGSAGGNTTAGSGGRPSGVVGVGGGDGANGGDNSNGGAGGGGYTPDTDAAGIGGFAVWGGAGGGGSKSFTNGNGGAGGDSHYGGGGGGGAAINASATNAAGGVSKLGGNGGAGGHSSVNGTAGSVPGGGGGGAEVANSGAGGKGKAIITSFA